MMWHRQMNQASATVEALFMHTNWDFLCSSSFGNKICFVCIICNLESYISHPYPLKADFKILEAQRFFPVSLWSYVF